jgi:hypothetical protein
MLALSREESLALFWAKVRRSDGCWEWTGARHKHGYGKLSRSGRCYVAHRFAWEMTVGPIPGALQVCHRCDNRLCVRPDHLFLGTQKDNIADMLGKGRGSLPPGTLARRSQTHCSRGHEFTAANTRTYRGARFCRACEKVRAPLKWQRILARREAST